MHDIEEKALETASGYLSQSQKCTIFSNDADGL